MNPSRPQSQSLLPPVTAATGYSVVLPPGWRKIPLRTGTEKAIRAVVREAFAALPRDAPPDKVGPHRLQLERTLARMVRDARQGRHRPVPPGRPGLRSAAGRLVHRLRTFSRPRRPGQ